MALRDEILPYVDGNRLVAPNVISPGTIQGSDNGVCFTSEYYVMLKKMGQLNSQDLIDFQSRIGQCINSKGMLCRVPIGQDDGLEQVDDYYGSLNGCMQLGNTQIPRQFLKALFKNFGFMDNENPGSLWNWYAFIPRQPQLVAAMVAASFPSWKNPLHILMRLLFLPAFIYSAGTIAISCIGADINDTDSRRLCWHLMQAVKPVSLLSWLASKIWLKRLYKNYGPTGMQAVAEIYYQKNHPFAKYWVTE